MKIWDAVVVGAGPAGCACAYDLASAGKSVLLLDKSDFPRPKACAGGLTMKTVRALRFSIEPVIQQKVDRILLESRDSSRIPVGRRRSICVMTVRAELDAFCLTKTIEAGAVFQRIRRIDSIAHDEEKVVVTAADGVLHARFLVGADGANSQVRTMCSEGGTSEAGWFRKGLAIEANLRRDAHKDDLVFDFSPVMSGYGWIFPKRDHVNIGLYCIDAEEVLNRSRLSTYITQQFGDDVKTEDFAGQYVGFGAAKHSAKNDRIFLVGDAGGFVDPLTGEGIYGAVMSGQAAASAICAQLNHRATARETFISRTKDLRENLQIAERIATSFYADPQRGFRVMKNPLLRYAVLKNYADGLQLTGLLRTTRRLSLHRSSAS